MLRQRIVTALLLAPLVILLILLLPTPIFAVCLGITFLAAMWEWTRLSGLKDANVCVALLLFTAVILALLWWLRASLWLWPAVVMAGVAWWVVACFWLRHFAFGAAPTQENRHLKLLAGALVIIPAWVAGVMLHRSGPHGPFWAFLGMLLVWAADTGAYFSGRLFGKRKLAPQISPGKTWAGVYGAFVASALVVAVGGWLLGVRDVRLFGLMVVAVVTIASSIVGDLLESLMKRHANVKDSGTLFPGHGGLLDRLDSVFAALPVFALGKWLLGL